MPDGQLDRHTRPGSLESRVRRNSQARFGGGPMEKARASGTSLAAYPTLREPEGETPSGHSPSAGDLPVQQPATSYAASQERAASRADVLELRRATAKSHINVGLTIQKDD